MDREEALLDLRRVQRKGHPTTAVLVSLQGLARTRHTHALFHFLRRGLQELVERAEGRLHVLGDARFLLLLGEPVETVERQLAILFEVERAEPGDPEWWHRFCEIFPLPEMYMALRERMDELDQAPEDEPQGVPEEDPSEQHPAHDGRDGCEGPPTGELDAAKLPVLLSLLDGIDLTQFVRRQGIYRLAERPQAVYYELFVSLGDVVRAACPQMSVPAASPLGLEVRRHLDRLLLAQLLIDRPFDGAMTGINLSMAAVASPEFGWLVERTRPEQRARLVIELDWLEVLADLRADGPVCAQLRAAGFPLAVDGVGPVALRWTVPDWLDFPIVKVPFSDEAGARFTDPDLVDRIAALPAETVVLSRCDNRAALAAARRLGVRHLQGWLIDRFVRESAVSVREPAAP